MNLSRLRMLFRSRLLFNDLSRSTPISTEFGLDRGTPVDRYYVERFLKQEKHAIRGSVLEVGDCAYTRRFGENVNESIVLHVTGGPGVSLVGDLSAPETLPEAVADCFICTQTLNFVYDVSAALWGAHRLLKPGGTLLVTVAGISQISRYDMDRWGDYWRFTTASLQRLCTGQPWDQLVIESYGNMLAAVAFLQGVTVEDLPEPKSLDIRDPDYQLLLTIVARKKV